jgi:hypothetical protein
VALVRATAHRKAVQTRHSPPWYERSCKRPPASTRHTRLSRLFRRD